MVERRASGFFGSRSPMFIRRSPLASPLARAGPSLKACPKGEKASGRSVACGSWTCEIRSISIWSISASGPFPSGEVATGTREAHSSIAGPARTRQSPMMMRVVRLHFRFESAFILVLLGGLRTLLRRNKRPRLPAGGARWLERRKAQTYRTPDQGRGRRMGAPPLRPRSSFNEPAVGSALNLGELVDALPIYGEGRGLSRKNCGGTEIGSIH